MAHGPARTDSVTNLQSISAHLAVFCDETKLRFECGVEVRSIGLDECSSEDVYLDGGGPGR